MDIRGKVAVVTGGGSGLGRATAESLARGGAHVVIVDLPSSPGLRIAKEIGGEARFEAADVSSPEQMQAAFEAAKALGIVRATVHCAGSGGPTRILDREGKPAALEAFERVVRINLVGSFNVLRLAAAAMAEEDEDDGERGVIVLTASVAAFEGQIGQLPYAASKAGIVGMTITAARDLADRKIRVCTIAPGIFDTPILAKMKPDIRVALEAATPHPSRLGRPSEFALLAAQIIENPMLNGETIRIDGAIRMAPR